MPGSRLEDSSPRPQCLRAGRKCNANVFKQTDQPNKAHATWELAEQCCGERGSTALADTRLVASNTISHSNLLSASFREAPIGSARSSWRAPTPEGVRQHDGELRQWPSKYDTTNPGCLGLWTLSCGRRATGRVCHKRGAGHRNRNLIGRTNQPGYSESCHWRNAGPEWSRRLTNYSPA
jgi:hypothetical protein